MNKNILTHNLGIILAVGSVWGLTEFLFGLGLQKCAALYTGAILTGLAFFWLSFTWSISRSLVPVLIIVGMAVLFKFLDALLLRQAWNHGSIINPIWAFLTVMTGFVVLILLFRNLFTRKLLYRILIGAGAAVIATALFPLARFTTGNPACMYAATNIPLVIFTAPVAILISMVTVPLGFNVAHWYTRSTERTPSISQSSWLARYWSPAVIVSCLLIITLARLL
jgi:hypothetical protein